MLTRTDLWASEAERNDRFAKSWRVTTIKRRPKMGLLDITLDCLSYPAQMEVVSDLLGNGAVQVRNWHGRENDHKWKVFTDRQKRRQDRDFTAALEWLIKKALLPQRDRDIAEHITQLRLLTEEEPDRRLQIARELTEK